MHQKTFDDTLLPEGIFRQEYWVKHEKIFEQIPFKNRIFYSKYSRIAMPLDDQLVLRHLDRTITLAHSLIFTDDQIQNIVIDYNGSDAPKFYHHLKRQLYQLGINNFTPYRSKSPNHLHIYLHYEPMPLQKGLQLGKIISGKLSDKLASQWRIYPNVNLPREYHILNLPFNHF